MKSLCRIAICFLFILNLANLAYARARKDVSSDNPSGSVDTSAASANSQPSAAAAQSSQSSESMSAKTAEAAPLAIDTTKAENSKSKRGPRSKVSEAPAVATPAVQPTKTAANAPTAAMDSEAQAKADALKKAEQKMQASESSASSPAVQPEMGAAARAEEEKAKAIEDAERARAEAEAKAAEAETEAAAARAQKAAKATAATAAATPLAKGAFAPFYVYKDQGARGNHYIPSGWMGDYGDMKINPGCNIKVHSGTTAFQVKYNAKMAQNAGWCGIYWQNPPNNWGDKKGGFNLTGAKKLTFWACGEKGGEVISEFKVGGISGEYPDSDSASIGPIELSKKWQQYTIDLTGRDLTNIIGGF